MTLSKITKEVIENTENTENNDKEYIMGEIAISPDNGAIIGEAELIAKTRRNDMIEEAVLALILEKITDY